MSERVLSSSSTFESLAEVSKTQDESLQSLSLQRESIYKSPLLNVSNRETCRICLSDSGELLSPCGCIGTVAHIHSACLSHWITLKNDKTCELCNQSYCIKETRFNTLKKWSKPEVTSENIWNILNIVGLIYSIVFTCKLLNERLTYDRLIGKNPFRADDFIRTANLFFLIVCLVSITRYMITEVFSYLNKQKVLYFYNKSEEKPA